MHSCYCALQQSNYSVFGGSLREQSINKCSSFQSCTAQQSNVLFQSIQTETPGLASRVSPRPVWRSEGLLPHPAG